MQPSEQEEGGDNKTVAKTNRIIDKSNKTVAESYIYRTVAKSSKNYAEADFKELFISFQVF